MFSRLGKSITRRPWAYLGSWLVITVLSALAVLVGFGSGNLFQRLDVDESLVNDSNSQQASQLLKDTSAGEQDLIVVSGVTLGDITTTPPTLSPYAVEVTEEAMAFSATLAEIPGVQQVLSPFPTLVSYQLGNQPTSAELQQAMAMMSSEGSGFVIAVALEPNLDSDALATARDQITAQTDQFSADLASIVPGSQVRTLSNDLISDAILALVQKDLLRGETIGLPIALLLMLIVFGGLIAAGMPLTGAIVSILVSMFALFGLTYAITVESFILNVVSIIGLALSIDYGLLVVSRFREEAAIIIKNRTDGLTASELDKATRVEIAKTATRTAVETAGRTVTFSAFTIAFAVTSLLVMKAPMLRHISVGGIIVILVAVASAITLVPSLLAVLGHRVIKPSPVTKVPVLKQAIKAVGDSSNDQGAFSKLARWVHKRPWPIMVGLTAILVGMAIPIGDLRLRSNFVEYLPKDSEVSTAYYIVDGEYPLLSTPDITVVAATTDENQISALTAKLAAEPNVTYALPAQPLPNASEGVSIAVKTDFGDKAGSDITNLVKTIRDYDTGYGIYTSGAASLQLDFNQSLADGAAGAAAIMVVAVLLLLFLMTGSVLVPLTALVINGLSLLASIGISVLIFEHGLFGLPQMNGLETFTFAIALTFGFGLAMDYEVFLLARIKEYWDMYGDNATAVERGLQRSGRIITSAAAIIIAVFIGFVFGDMQAIKEIGVILAIVVIVDATLIRLLLVPSVMTILRKWNWWAPTPLQKLYNRFGISESGTRPTPDAKPALAAKVEPGTSSDITPIPTPDTEPDPAGETKP